MKYKRGCKVEVLTTDDVPYHSWRCAEIVSGNGHNYTVQYEVYPGFIDDGKVGHVSRKFIRPCPPRVEILECSPGDVVEVFHNLSWKMAVVSKPLSCDLFLVRLVGSFLEFEVSISELRVRQSWQNDEWVVIGKVHINSEDRRLNKHRKHKLNSGSQEKQRGSKEDFYMKSLQFGVQNDNLQESRIVSTRTLKRGSPYCFSQDEVNAGSAQKLRLTIKDGKLLRVLGTSPEKVDADPNSRKLMCEKSMYTSLDNKAARLYAAAMEREDLTDAYRRSHILSKEPNDDNITCSIGSCSINSHMHSDMRSKSVGFEDTESHDSDSESVCQRGYQEDLHLGQKELSAEIHRLELQAYRCTIKALHASGPLSWEKETMVTNLRMLLHISNDEHLIEIKKLISSR